MEKKETKVFVSFGGGKRGIAKAIVEEYKRSGYQIIICHRDANKKQSHELTNEKYLDIEENSSVENAKLMLNKMIEENYNELIVLFPTGGAMNSTKYKCPDRHVEAIFQHNYFVPAMVTDFLNEVKQRERSTCRIRTIFISSAAAVHLNSAPHYCAAKASLETYYKAKFKHNQTCIEMYLYRLGLVDVDYKHFHNLASKNPEKFKEFMKDNIPSGHFTKPEEVARIIRKTMLDSIASNGIFCDISGGNSWM